MKDTASAASRLETFLRLSLIEGFTNPSMVRQVRPAVITDASKTGSEVTYTLRSGEVAPNVGAVVTVSGMDDDTFNLSSAVVDSRTATTFVVSSRYHGTAERSPTRLRWPPNPRRSSVRPSFHGVSSGSDGSAFGPMAPGLTQKSCAAAGPPAKIGRAHV